MTEIITPRQAKQIKRLCEDVLDATEMDKEMAQRVISRGEKLQEKLQVVIREIGKLLYADDQTKSNFSYPECFRVRTAAEQAETLFKFFPNLDASYVAELASGKLPKWAEGWAIIPKPSKVMDGDYHRALEQALE